MLLEFVVVGVVGGFFVAGVLIGMLLARQVRIYREATRRGGVVDLTGRRL